jgi:cell division septum initiation protein DivIVA
MRISLATTGVLALLLAGCGGVGDEQSESSPAASNLATTSSSDSAANMSAADVEEAPAVDPLAPTERAQDGEAPRPPEVAPDSAPDVAFGYRYNFGLAADRIAPVQQRHARLCEELGPERCKVTGMSYRQRREDDVQAELRLALEPGLAHRFGERALESVREAEGKLVDSQVTGTDVGSSIRGSTRTIAQIEEQLAELEARIAAGGSTGTLRDLRAEAAMLREQLRSLRGSRGEARERLATAPVTLNYASGAYATGEPNLGGALTAAWDQAKWLAYGLFALLMVLAPWAALGALGWLVVRALRRRRGRVDAAEAASLA